jgi:hypothetical protein
MRQVVSSRKGWSAGLISVNLWRSLPAPMRTADQGCRPTPRRSVRQRHSGRRRRRRRRGLSRRSNPDVGRRQWPPAARPPLRIADEIIRTIVIAAGWPTSSRPTSMPLVRHRPHPHTGTDIVTAAELLGHASPDSTRIFGRKLRMGLLGVVGQGRISTYPSVPCTRIRCPSRISRVACSTPMTGPRPRVATRPGRAAVTGRQGPGATLSRARCGGLRRRCCPGQ